MREFTRLVIVSALALLIGATPIAASTGFTSIDTGYTITKVRSAANRGITYIVASSYEATVLGISYGGRIGWKHELSGYMNRDLWCEDITGDGSDEVLAANADGTLYCLDGMGRLLWQFKANDAPMNAVCVLYHNDVPYVVCGGYEMNIYYLTARGELVKTIASSTYSQEKAWGKPDEKRFPEGKGHIANFIRKVRGPAGEEALAVHGILNSNSTTGSIYLFKPLADVFQQNGYRTAIFGKWHLGDNYPFRPMDRGFGKSLIHGGGVVGETPDYWDNNYYDDVYFRNGKPEQVKGYCTDVWFNETMRFMEKNQGRPFFIYLPTNAPHGPLHVPEKYRLPYLDQKGRSEFYGMIANIDENIGRLRAKLEELSLDRDTILVFFNDNGTNGGVTVTKIDGNTRNGWEESGFNAGMRGKKTSRYEGGHRAACFIRWPNGGITGGRDVNGVTAHIDLLPTFIDLCGLEFEDRARFDGISLASALKAERSSARERTVVVHDQGRFGQPIGEGLLIKEKDYSVMRGAWRLVGNELFDLSTDPGQRNDIAAQHPQVAERLRSDYETWWKHIAARSDEICPFVVNPAKQTTVLISSQNLLGAEVAYSQRHVRQGDGGEGWAVIDVEVPGTYRISLRRWPRESRLPIRSEAPPCPMHPSTHKVTKTPCKVLEVVKARLKVGESDQTAAVNESDEEIVFEVDLAVGEQRIQTWFTMEDSQQIAAYYTYIEPVQIPNTKE